MRISVAQSEKSRRFRKTSALRRGYARGAYVAGVLMLTSLPVYRGWCADPSDPIINLFLEKGFITENEAAKAKAEIEAMRTNRTEMPEIKDSKWSFKEPIKKVQLFGDVRLRFEDRSADAPGGGDIELRRFRYAVRLGAQGEVFDDFYFGLRVDTSANPRSSWVSFGTSASSTLYQGPFGKSNAGLGIGQAYLGWRPAQWDWLDITAGKMPNPLFTTPMVWDSDINVEGLAERFKYNVGDAEFFANFGQFIYQDMNPVSASGGLGINGLVGQETENIFMLAWQGGFKYRFSTNTTAKIAATIYNYVGLQRSTATSSSSLSPYFGDPYIGEGAYLGPGSGTVEGGSGYGSSSSLPGYRSTGFPLNQVGLNDLLVVDVPFEVNFKIRQLDSKVFGDVAYNLNGKDRAQAAADGYANWLASQPTTPTIQPFAPQKSENLAYQIGFAVGQKDGPNGPLNHPWEVRTFWQHIEQYALDPNIIDSDIFEGRENMEGINVQLTYGFTRNVLASVRYGYATRINSALGTGGSNQDIPQINPIDQFNLLQLDLTLKF